MNKNVMRLIVCLTILVGVWPRNIQVQAASDWPMSAGNAQRTSHNDMSVSGALNVEWYRAIDPFVDANVQIIAADDTNGGTDGKKIFLSTSEGLVALNADTGAQSWFFGTELPPGNSPTIATINNKKIAYLPGFDHRIRAIDTVTGLQMSGYTPYEAGAGFETNPLIIGNTIYAGNRDGNFYALNATTGSKMWQFQTNGPIRFSAAASHDNSTIFFASEDSYGYALNAANGELKWKTPKLPGYGFSAYWPVVWTDTFSSSPTYNQEFVLFTASQKTSWILPIVNGETTDSYFKQNSGIPWDCAASSTSYLWTSATQVLNCPGLLSYFNTTRPDRRNLFIFAVNQGTLSTAAEYTPYAPVNWQGAGNGGNKFPPVVAADNVLYTGIGHSGGGNGGSKGWISGWKFGTSYISNIYNPGSGAADEPYAITSGGNLIYWAEGINSDIYGTLDITKSVGSNKVGWNPNSTILSSSRYSNNSGYPSLGLDGTFNGVAGNNKVNGIYGIYDGVTSMSAVPYNNKLYLVEGNVLVAMSTVGGAHKITPDITAPSSLTPANVTLSRDDLLTKLTSEVQKIISAGHLRPAFMDSGYLNRYFDGNYNNSTGAPLNSIVAGDHLMEYFHTPGETLSTLTSALPYLSSTMQSQVKTYLQQEQTSYPVQSIAHIGWKTGTLRETYPDTTDLSNFFNGSAPSGGWITMTGPLQTSLTYPNSCCTTFINIGSFPADAPYGAWKYAQSQGMSQSQAMTLFNAVKGTLQKAGTNNNLNDTNLAMWPYILNQYIDGYRGYLELEKMANGWTDITNDTTVYPEYKRLLELRTTKFAKDAPVWGMNQYPENRILNTARNFMYMTPQLGDCLINPKTTACLGANSTVSGIQSTAQTALNEYYTIEPFWFLAHYTRHNEEGLGAPLWSRSALFLAKAYVLKEPYSELVKYVDVPAFERGDLFWIQNAVATLAAPDDSVPSPSLAPSPSPKPGDADGNGKVDGVDYVTWFNHYNQVIPGGNTVGDFNTSGKVDGVDYTIWFNNYGK